MKVNGDIITKTELEERQIAALRERKVNPEVLKNDEQLKKALAEVTPQILVNAIDELLVIQLGREKGMRLSDEQFNRWLTSMRKDQGLEDDKRFQDGAEAGRHGDQRYPPERRAAVPAAAGAARGVRRQAADHRGRGAAVLPGEPEGVRRAGNGHAARDPDRSADRDAAGRPMVSVGRDDEAAKKAEAVRARLAAGEDFAKVAGEVSAGASKANGGLIGPIAVSELSQDLQKTLENMKPGDITQPMRPPRATRS